MNTTERTIKALMAAFAVAALLSGCAGCGPEEESACDNVTCEAGVCDSVTGACVNAPDCAGDDANCLDGFVCGNDVCIAEVACNTDGTCDRGECFAGACLNPDSCTTNSNCIEGDWCDDGTCVDDPCAETTCDRGVCQIGVGECVNAGSCTTANEDEVCLDGFQCISGTCTDEATFCDSLTCDRGVCSFDEEACVNQDNCGGDDLNCLDGFFCADDNTCQENECEADMVMCDRGVCNPSTGACENAATCSDVDECTDGFVCLTDTCVDANEACGTDGCDGNQECAYDEAALTAACVESVDGCTNAIDCLDDRVCTDGACADAAACEADAYEANDDTANAVDFLTTAQFGEIRDLNICSGDADYFSFDTTLDPDGEGTLFARVDIAAEDVGLGTLRLQIIDPDGSTVVAESTNIDNGVPTDSIEVATTVDVLNSGVYFFHIADDASSVSTAGVDYTLTADLLPGDIVDTCAAATPLASANPVFGSTANATGTSLAASCVTDSDTRNDAVYAIDVTEDSWVEISVTPQAGSDVALSLRSVCQSSESEMACESTSGDDSIEMALTPGSYYVLVESQTDLDASFVLSYVATPQICDASDNTCVDTDNASVCNAQQTGFDTVSCDSGCDATSGACLRKPSDVCGTAIQVDAATGYTGLIDWASLENDYDTGDPGCVPDNSFSRTDGPDAAFEVTVPDGQIVTAEIERDGSNYISALITQNCADINNSCLAGVNASGGSDELIFWQNDTGSPQTVFVIAESEDWSSYGVSPIEINVAPVVCTPGDRRCRLDRESQICNPFGTGFTETEVCTSGCNTTTGFCAVTNDLCGGAIDISGGSTFAGTVVGYTDDYNEDVDCDELDGSDRSQDAADAVFLVTTTQADQTVTIDVNNVAGFDPIVWVSQSCDLSTNELGACSFGIDSDEGDDDPEQLVFFAETPGDYYVVVEDGDSSFSEGTFDITATIEAAECTTLDTILGCNATNTDVEQCNADGQFEDLGLCDVDGCNATTGTCVNPQGDICYDAIPLDPAGGSLVEQNFDADGTDAIDFGSGKTDQCDFPSSSDAGGEEVIYSITLAQGDLLTATATDSETDLNFYLQETCGADDSCLGFNGDGTSTIEYFAENAGELFLVIDSDSTFNSFDYDLTWAVTQPGWICQPDTASCADATTLATCASDGLSEAFTTCPGGTTCTDDACVADPAQVDTCAGAVDLGTGATLVVDPFALTDTQDPQGACEVGSLSEGPDAFFSVTVNANDVITASYVGLDDSDDPGLYIFQDCADIDGTCVGADSVFNDTVTVSYFAQTAGTYIIAADTDTTFVDSYQLDVNVEAGCNPAAAPTCNVDGDIEYCVQGVLETYDCAGGACTNGACDTPRGDACFDAIPVTGQSGTINGTWTNNVDTLDTGGDVGAACDFDSAPDGADDIYAITLAADDLLEVTVNSDETSLEAYILEDCADTQTCVSGADGDGSTSPAELRYLSDAARTVYLVVDRSDSDTDNTYTVDWTITPNIVCLSDTWSCVDADTTGLCNGNGSGFDQQLDCTTSCNEGFCDDDPTVGDTCATAETIASTTRIALDWADYTDATQQDDTGCALDTFDTDGEDKFFSVSLAANDVLRVSSAPTGASDSDPAVYIYTSCTDPGGSCLAGDDAENSPAVTQYQALVAQTVIVGIDSDDANTGEGARISIEIDSPDCDPTTFTQACNTDGDGFIYCPDNGFSETYFCQGNGVCDATTGRCEEPVGDVCIDPFVANPTTIGTPETFSGTFTGFNDDYDLGTGNACTLSRTIGDEPVYAVDLTSGQSLSVSAVSTEATGLEDIAVYATNDCTNVRNQCLAGSDAEGATANPETFTYGPVTADETVYIMVDSFYSDVAGTFDLTVDVTN